LSQPTALFIFIIQIRHFKSSVPLSVDRYQRARRNDPSLTPSLEREPVEPHCMSSALRAILVRSMHSTCQAPYSPSLFFTRHAVCSLLHVTDLKLSNRDSRASLQRTRNVVRNFCRPLCIANEREAESVFQTALRVRRSIPNEREVYRRRSRHRVRRFEASETREEHLPCCSLRNIQSPSF